MKTKKLIAKHYAIKQRRKKALWSSLVACLLCFTMLLGVTYAWFTDSVTSSGNKITAGTLSVNLHKYTDVDVSTNLTASGAAVFDKSVIWEPGMTQVAYLGVENTGDLALKYKAVLTATDGKLLEVLDYAITFGADANYGYVNAWDATAGKPVVAGVNETAVKDVVLNAGEKSYFALSVHMDELAGNEYMGQTVVFDIKILATQASVETDSFGSSDYDAGAEYPTFSYGQVTAPVVEGEAVHVEVRDPDNYDKKLGSVLVPATAIAEDTEDVTVMISKSDYKGNITVASDEDTIAYDVKVIGLKKNNDAPVKVTLNADAGLNPAFVKLYHYDTQITDFDYNPNTGVVSFETTDFSPFTIVYNAEEVYETPTADKDNAPKAIVTYMAEYVGEGKISWGSFGQWSPTAGLDADLEAAYKFECPANVDPAYKYWNCDFYVSLDTALGANQIFLGGNYGTLGWIGFHNGDLTLAANEEVALLGSVTKNPWTYADIENYVGTFICGVGDVDDALSGATFTVKLRLTNPENAADFVDVNTVTYTFGGITVSAPVVTDTDNKVVENTVAEKNGVVATIPAGVQLKPGTTEVTLTVKDVANSAANVVVGNDEQKRSREVHVEGVAEGNTVVIPVYLPQEFPVGLNMGNYRVYHVENGETVAMTLRANGATPVHNNYDYDPATGDVTLYLASFSEIDFVINKVSVWEGGFDYSWYDEDATELTIANADQLAAFGAIVGGMNGRTQDSFADKTVKLVADINLGDAEANDNADLIFYPIGYYNTDGTYEKTQQAISSWFEPFMGTFNGDGHTVANFYQNTWDMKGDNNYYAAEEQRYRDGMGLFGKVYGGTVKNLLVENFSCDGEYTTTGVIAAYADFGATFENIAIVNCNPRVYNIGNGGIVGCVGWYTEGVTETPVSFTNITVDNSNKISALWGSWDVACGGIVGQYYPTSGQSAANYPKNAGVTFNNCHVSAQIDVYNDVCANYQYYAYRYSGMLIGSVRENETIDGHVYPKTDGITATDCTVHFGTWNDYYYCELVANTLASYTHDHQMSRLDQVAAVDVENMKVTLMSGQIVDIPASGRYNYVVVTGDHATENAECFHFVDGAVWNHADAGTETVDGETVLKEDKQHIYREFNNLFTGYGWGVTSKGLTDYVGVENMDIQKGDLEASVKKFDEKIEGAVDGKEYKLGDIFEHISDVKVVNGAVTVTVTNLDEGDPVSAIFVRDLNNWENGTLTLTGKGRVWITIQDYYFCKPLTIEVLVGDNGAVILPPIEF